MSTQTKHLSDEQLRSLQPRQVCQQAGYEDPDAAGVELIEDLLNTYIEGGRPYAYELAQDALYSVGYLEDVARVLAGFAGSWGREPVCEVLGWRESDETGEVSVGEILTATFFKVVLELSSAVLALDGRLSTGEDA